MKKILKWLGRIVLILIAIAPFALLGFLEYRAPLTKAEFDAGDPQNTKIIWTDFDAFWQAVDASKKADNIYEKAIFDRVYKENRTDGLDKFDMLRYGGGGAVYNTHKFIPFYESFRSSLIKDAFNKNAIAEVFAKVRTYYPDAPIPNVRVFMGLANNGGTITKGDIIIAYEMFSKNTNADWDKLDVKQTFKDFLQWYALEANVTSTTEIIAHEYMHYLQASRMNILSRNFRKLKMLIGNITLLQNSFEEGVASFLQSVLTGDPSQAHKRIQQYVDTNGGTEKFLAEFTTNKDTSDEDTMRDWLYSVETSDGRPSDMGYWMGAVIAEMYWDKNANKQQAFMDLIGDKPVDEIFAIAVGQ